MDSPPRRRPIPSPPSSRPPGEAFVNFNLISSLPPKNSTNRVWYPQKFSESNLPPPPPVFASPHIDMQRESSLLTSGNIIAADGVLNTLVAPTGHQGVDGRLNDLPDVPTRKVNGLWDPTSGAQHSEQFGSQTFVSYEDCLRSSRVVFKGSFEEAGQHQGMHRHLQFEIAGACNSVTTENSHNSWRLANNYASSRLPESQLSFQQGGIFRNQTPVSHSPLLSHWSLCPARIPEILTGMAGNSAILAPGNLFTSEVNDMTADLNRISPRKMRKTATHTTESDRKHCNCKRTQCLKLSYCDCLAAGVYCTDSCACSNCLNKSENEGVVQIIREKIESRDPLAFAPRIVNPDTDTSVEDGNWTTPSSARHKRGCNCKKSMCQKKYCECYQAGIGCSDGCRCEDCRNSFGIKADRRAERWGVQSHGELNMGGADQFSPEWEGITDINQITPLSHPHSGAGASSASPNPRDFPEVLHAELYRGNNSQTSAGALHWSSSSNTLVPLRHGNEAPQELSSDSAQHALTKDDDTPKILSSSPNGPMQACSSNQKCVSPPQIQLKDTSLRPSPSLTNEQTIIRLGTPSVRPFSWCSNSKDGIPQIKSHPNDSTSNQ
ncbi:protein tesmin/TSO1-like CXC 3 isoform X1 [Vitis vinifera]|uniref:protein tesmin/TSO1-like CXC 3 isoform X1 n=1 Tax=Vitis vinifera TaxID=29760 RepID=UPI0028835364|nr:protein tesmin/TSO1-like CXC 3 isoform X1 [Vitis vinifera]XP_059595515.1 protein tesmin/TSO1-like CXC 3 isoform X1 [Vitis vinifera]